MFEILKDAWKVRHPALLYLKKYGIKATLLKINFVYSNGGLKYYNSAPNSKFNNIFNLENQARIIFVSNDLGSVSHEYRIRNLSRAYWEMGIPNVITDIHQLKKLNKIPKSLLLMYFWRTNIDLETFDWFITAKKQGIIFAYDSDDLTFDERFYNFENVAGLRYLPKEQALHLTKTVCLEQARQIKQSDIAIAGTTQLQDSFRFLGTSTLLVPNFAPRWMEHQARKIRSSRCKEQVSQKLKIVYASGSRTHQKDFLTAQDAIFKFLIANQNATLTIIGAPPLEKNQIPDAIAHQILFKQMVKHEDLLPELSNYDVHIAPLEENNPFVEAKSNLKFIHAGLLGAPIIATPTEPFRNCISNGLNGYLASDTSDWIKALEKLADRDHRAQIGEAALASILNNSLTESAYVDLRNLLAVNPQTPKNLTPFENNKSNRKIVWVLPSLMIGSGGHRNVFRMANKLQSSSFSNSICFTEDLREKEVLKKLINSQYLNMEFEVESTDEAFVDADLLIGTHYSTVNFIRSQIGKNQEIAYFVQDFEPWFYPMSENYLSALNTYLDEDISIVTSGKWMAEKIFELTNRKVPYFQLPVNKEIYKKPINESREGILFFAKSDTPRRLYDFGIRCLEIISSIDPTLPIYLYGSSNDKHLNFSFTDLGQLPTLEDLSNLYSKTKVGIVFSPTNPSLVPYEMMACGLPIVDIDLPGTPMQKFGSISSEITCNFDEVEVASRILKLVSDERYWLNISEAGLRFIDEMPDEDQAAEIVREFVSKIFESS